MDTTASQQLEAWHMPIIGYVQWYLLRGKTPDQIRLALRESDRYPDLTEADWQLCLARGAADAAATIKCRTCSPDTEVRELWRE